MLLLAGVSTRVSRRSVLDPVEREAPSRGDLTNTRGKEVDRCGLTMRLLEPPLVDGLDLVLRLREGPRLGAGEAIDGLDGSDRLGRSDGLDGILSDRRLELIDGLEGTVTGALPGLGDALRLRDGERLRPGLMDARLSAIRLWSALRPARLRDSARDRDCAELDSDNPISRAATSMMAIPAALASCLSPMTNMAVSFPSPTALVASANICWQRSYSLRAECPVTGKPPGSRRRTEPPSSP